MNVKVTNIEENVVELEFAIDNAKFKEGIMKSYRKNVKRFNVPGFRKGKAPKMIIDKMYGPEIFYDDAINFVFPDAYDEAVKPRSPLWTVLRWMSRRSPRTRILY